MKIRTEKSMAGILLLFSIVQVIFVLLLYKRGLIVYETNDDYWLNAVVCGLCQSDFDANMFSNVIYCWIIHYLYIILPICNWMTVGYIIIVICSYVSISYVFCKVNLNNGLLLFVIFFICTYYDFICKLNFTRVAAISTFAGALLIIFFMFYSEGNTIVFVIGIIMLELGMMISKCSIVSTLPNIKPLC